MAQQGWIIVAITIGSSPVWHRTICSTYTHLWVIVPPKKCEVLIKIGNEILEKMQLEYGVFKVATIFFISQYGSGHEGAVALLTGFAIIWFCYQMIAKPGNKTAVPSWPDTYGTVDINNNSTLHSVGITPCRPRRNHTSGSVAHAMQFSAPSDHRWNKSCSVGDHGTSSWTCGDKTNPKKKIIYCFFKVRH